MEFYLYQLYLQQYPKLQWNHFQCSLHYLPLEGPMSHPCTSSFHFCLIISIFECLCSKVNILIEGVQTHPQQHSGHRKFVNCRCYLHSHTQMYNHLSRSFHIHILKSNRIKTFKFRIQTCKSEFRRMNTLVITQYISNRCVNVMAIRVVEFSKGGYKNSFIFEPDVEKIYMDVFSTHFVPLISILAPKIMKKENNQL